MGIRLIRKAHKIVLDFKDIWNLQDEDDSFLFTNPHNDHQSTVSFNHADQMQCNCSWYINERFVCPHMLVILEQRVLPDLQDENKDITDIIAMTSIFKKKQATEIIDHASHFLKSRSSFNQHVQEKFPTIKDITSYMSHLNYQISIWPLMQRI